MNVQKYIICIFSVFTNKFYAWEDSSTSRLSYIFFSALSSDTHDVHQLRNVFPANPQTIQDVISAILYSVFVTPFWVCSAINIVALFSRLTICFTGPNIRVVSSPIVYPSLIFRFFTLPISIWIPTKTLLTTTINFVTHDNLNARFAYIHKTLLNFHKIRRKI